MSPDESWLSYQIDRSVFTFGSFIKARIEATIEVPMKAKSKKEKPTEIKPKYTKEQVEAMIYDPLPEVGEMVDVGEPNKWGNIDPFDVQADASRPVPAKYKNGPKILPHEMTN